MEKHVESCGSAYGAFASRSQAAHRGHRDSVRIILILLRLKCCWRFSPGELDTFSLKWANGILHRFAAGVLRKSIP